MNATLLFNLRLQRHALMQFAVHSERGAYDEAAEWAKVFDAAQRMEVAIPKTLGWKPEDFLRVRIEELEEELE